MTRIETDRAPSTTPWRILIIAPCFPPQNSAAATRTLGFAHHWAATGHEITVLTTEKRADQGGMVQEPDGYSVVSLPFSVPRFLERLRGHNVAELGAATAPVHRPAWLDLAARLRGRTGIYSLDRFPDLTDHWVKPAIAWARSRGVTWDAVVSSSPPYTAHLVALALRREGICGRWLCDFQDPWTRHHAFTGMFPFTLVESFLEHQCLAHADVITTVTDGFARGFRNRTRAPVEVVSNGFDAEAVLPESTSRILPADGRIRIAYTGTLYPRGQDATVFLAAIAEATGAPDQPGVAEDGVELVVASLFERHWRDLAADFGVADRVRHLAGLSRVDSLRLQREADALLLVDWNDPSAGVIPSKIFEYMQATAPILAVGGAPHSAVGELLRKTGRGIHLGSDKSAIAAFLRKLGRPGADLRLERNDAEIRKFTVENLSLKYLELVTSRP